MFAEKFRQPPHNNVVKHVHWRVVCRDDNTGALVYSTDLPTPITIQALRILGEETL